MTKYHQLPDENSREWSSLEDEAVHDGQPSFGYAVELVRKLAALPAETEWLEFKHNNADPGEIGKQISALANAAALAMREYAYMLWGVDDDSHEIVGTEFNPDAEKVGNAPLKSWLHQNLDPKTDFHFITANVDGAGVVLLRIDAAAHHPVRFKGAEYIRVGSAKKEMRFAPEKAEKLRSILSRQAFGARNVEENVSAEQVLGKLEYQAYFELLSIPLPEGRDGILEKLAGDRLIRRCDAGGWNITELGATLFARRLDDFDSLRYRGVRVLQYEGTGKTSDVRNDQEFKIGYASGFNEMNRYINGLLPDEETIRTFRKTVPMYPEAAVRELLANALIHQDFSIKGTKVMVEVFPDRLQISNPGVPLVEDILRLLDTTPLARNETLAGLMRRCGLCEESGRGIDRVVESMEALQLPAPYFESGPHYTRATLFARMPFGKMESRKRIHACYWHACLQHVGGQVMTNTTLRERFGMDTKGGAAISRLIRATMDKGLIIPVDADAATKSMRYLPFWAAK